MGNDFNKAVGQRLYLARKAKGYSRAKVGELVGLHETTVKRYEDGDIKSLDIERLKAFARVLGTPAADLLGWVADSDENLELMLQISEDSASGRPAAIDELRRLFGTEHSIHNIYACEDNKRIALLYYKALERNVALSLTDIIGTVDQFDGSQAEKTMLLLHAYLKAGQPIRNIVDTALDPYVEDLDEFPCSNSQIDTLEPDTASAPASRAFVVATPAFSAADSALRREASSLSAEASSDARAFVSERSAAVAAFCAAVFEEAAAAGLGNYLSDTPVTHMEQYPSGIIPSGTNYGVPISGDSMMPKFKNGSTAFVQSTPVLNAGEIGIFALNGNSYIKQLIVDRENGTVRLHSLNPAYKDIIVSEGDTLYTLGRVLGSYPE